MSNELKVEKKAQAVSMLCEGTSIRSVERITGIHRDTIMRLGGFMSMAHATPRLGAAQSEIFLALIPGML